MFATVPRNRVRLVVAALALLIVSSPLAPAWSQSANPRSEAKSAPGQQPREFTPGSWSRLDELPAGRVRTRLQQLPPPARERALRALRRFHFPEQDLIEALQVDANGGIYYADAFEAAPPGNPQQAGTAASASSGPLPVTPFPASLIFHSRPGSPNVLYIDFDGETVTGTGWNDDLERATIVAAPFDLDTSSATFSAYEQAAIKAIWQRMAEDFAPFNIDVTTERPSILTTTTLHVILTNSRDANGALNPKGDTSAGIAYVDIHGLQNAAYFRPAWCYVDKLAHYPSFIAECASHEIGHNLSLSHDGVTNGPAYYAGHGVGDTSWAPIMGTSYYSNVTQWSKGQYFQANNSQDDLAAISFRLGYRPDDRGDTAATATPLTFTGASVVATTPEDDPDNLNPENKGVLATNTDIDVYSFPWSGGPISLSAKPWIVPGATYRGGNLDVLLELRDASNALVTAANPPAQTDAFIQTVLTAGVYYLHVRNTGVGNPFGSGPDGYTAYGSIGQYFISIPGPSLTVDDVVVTEGNSGVTNATVTVTLDRPSAVETRVSYALAPGTATGGTYEFSDAGAVSVPDAGTANPYPDSVIVGQAPGVVRRVGVRLIEPAHASPADLDVLLVAPGGEKIMLMSDAGGASPLTTTELRFTAGAPVMTIDAIRPGYVAYSPTDLETGENLPTPAPPGPYGTDLSVLDNTSTAGTWQLYVADDAAGGGTGSFQWSLLFTPQGDDFDVQYGELVFPPGTTTQAITVRVFGDTDPEPDETLFVNLSAPVNAEILDGQGQVTINDDDEVAPADTDGDGIPDDTDNCTLVANANQRDTDGDGYGNICDPDFNNNGIVDSQDGALLKAAFGSSAFPDRDLNGNGLVDSQDGAILKARFGQPPGPSAVP